MTNTQQASLDNKQNMHYLFCYFENQSTPSLLRWRGSVYKLIYKELLAYISLYLVINLTYRLVLVRRSECDIKLESCMRWKQYKQIFESLRGYCYENLKSIPLMFVLGTVRITITPFFSVA